MMRLMRLVLADVRHIKLGWLLKSPRFELLVHKLLAVLHTFFGHLVFNIDTVLTAKMLLSDAIH